MSVFEVEIECSRFRTVSSSNERKPLVCIKAASTVSCYLGIYLKIQHLKDLFLNEGQPQFSMQLHRKTPLPGDIRALKVL